jgi:hypothetical protein
VGDPNTFTGIFSIGSAGGSAAAKAFAKRSKQPALCWALQMFVCRFGCSEWALYIRIRKQDRDQSDLPCLLSTCRFRRVHTSPKAKGGIKRQSADSKRRPQVCCDAVPDPHHGVHKQSSRE